jgi:hypothetical protein
VSANAVNLPVARSVIPRFTPDHFILSRLDRRSEDIGFRLFHLSKQCAGAIDDAFHRYGVGRVRLTHSRQVGRQKLALLFEIGARPVERSAALK